MAKSKSGFTIIELLIVIVVIAILASVVLVTYNGIQQRTRNGARLGEVRAWQKTLMLHYVDNSNGPNVPAGNYCLGSGFPSGACRDYLANNSVTYYEANNTALMAALLKSSSLPSGPRQPVNGTVGPYINLWAGGGGFTITNVFSGRSTDCPPPLTYTWDDGNGRLLCQVDMQYY